MSCTHVAVFCAAVMLVAIPALASETSLQSNEGKSVSQQQRPAPQKSFRGLQNVKGIIPALPDRELAKIGGSNVYMDSLFALQSNLSIVR
jgi:hypothetical protein